MSDAYHVEHDLNRSTLLITAEIEDGGVIIQVSEIPVLMQLLDTIMRAQAAYKGNTVLYTVQERGWTTR